ncbi:MAG: hypothetical protein GY731_14295, partial [Gammaproteobacteria bacterium]|nr:hypothetical protein [Gammaproteobacteria bacterium]
SYLLAASDESPDANLAWAVALLEEPGPDDHIRECANMVCSWIRLWRNSWNS